MNSLFKFLKYSFKARKSYYFWMTFQALLSTFKTLFNLYSLKILLDVLTSKTYQEVLVYGLIIVLVNLSVNFFESFLTQTISVSQNAMNDFIQLEVSKRLTQVPFSYLENPYYLDLKEKAKFACDNQSAIYQLLNLISVLVQSIIAIVTIATLLILFNFWILIVIIVALVIQVPLFVLFAKFQIDFYRKLLPINRCFGYFLHTLQNPEFQKDYRLSNLGKLTLANFQNYSDKTVTYFRQISNKQLFVSTGVEAVNYIQNGLIYLLVALRAIKQSLGVGAFTFYASSAIKLSSTISNLIQELNRFKMIIEYLKPLIELLELPKNEDQGDMELQDINSIEFRNVCFAYPNSDNMVLKDVSFTIQKGEKISIVGLNGAGKTTLVKLLSRLYAPQSGEILINGIDIYKYKYHSYIAKLSTVFQDYKLFAFTIGENITLSEKQNELALQYANQVGLGEKIASLPLGLDSIYSKSYSEEGVELSGGETQKIAIARCLAKSGDLIVLDEPTSALDPLAEAEIYAHFNEMVKDKTAIYISHRMSSSVFCDKVLIIDNGHILDFASHKELMKKKESLYYQLFTTQAKNYKLQ